MKSIKTIFSLRILYCILAIVFLITGILYICDTCSDYKKIAENQAVKLAESAKAFLQIELVKNLAVNSSDIEKPEYKQLKNSLKSFKESNDDVRFAYLYTLINEKIFFMADSEDIASEGYSPPGQYYPEASEEAIASFIQKKNIIAEPVNDSRGTWINVFIPIIDQQSQEVVAVFGIDYSARLWGMEIIKHIIFSAIMAICILFLLVLLYLIIFKNQVLNSASRKMHDNENFFRTIFKQVPVGIAVVNNFNFISGINEMLEKILGRSKKEMESIDWKDITHPEDLKEDLKLFKRFKSGKIDGYSLEKRFIKPDGSSVWVDMIVTRLNLREEKYYPHLCIMQDISEKKKALKTLEESERSKSILLSHLPGIAYSCKYDKDWTMLFISDGCFKLTGYKPENLINNKDLSYIQLIVPKYTDIIRKEVERAIALKTPF